jgi:hypothetical protein
MLPSLVAASPRAFVVVQRLLRNQGENNNAGWVTPSFYLRRHRGE